MLVNFAGLGYTNALFGETPFCKSNTNALLGETHFCKSNTNVWLVKLTFVKPDDLLKHFFVREGKLVIL